VYKIVKKCLKSNPNSKTPKPERLKHVLNKPSNCPSFLKLFCGMIRPDDLE